MPKVGKKHYSYTKKGMMMAEKAMGKMMAKKAVAKKKKAKKKK